MVIYQSRITGTSIGMQLVPDVNHLVAGHSMKVPFCALFDASSQWAGTKASAYIPSGLP